MNLSYFPDLLIYNQRLYSVFLEFVRSLLGLLHAGIQEPNRLFELFARKESYSRLCGQRQLVNDNLLCSLDESTKSELKMLNSLRMEC